LLIQIRGGIYIKIKELQSISEDIKSESLEGNSDVDNNEKKEIFGIYPLLPTREYNLAKRKELREFEQELLNGVHLDI